MLTITKIFEFEASHFLPNYEGACHNLHGHSYKLEVTVNGTIDDETGMIMDFKVLKDIVNKVVINKYDHSYLNDFFKNPTAENILIQISADIIDNLPEGITLDSCILWETSSSYAKYDHEKAKRVAKSLGINFK